MKADGLDATDRRPDGRRSAWLLIVAALATGIWFVALLLLAIRTANPVTINREQLLASDAVIIAVPESADGGAVSLKIERSLAGETLTGVLRAGGVEPERFDAGGRFLVPLRRQGRGYVVTPTPSAFERAPLVYLATDETLRAAEAILATETASPYE